MSLTIVDMTGDRYWPEVSREIRDELLNPFFDIDWKVHDISMQARDETSDGALFAAIADLKTHKAAVKGPTVTPTVEQTEEYGLSQQLKSPNGIIRTAINGAVIMRSPIEAKNIPQFSEKIQNVTTARQAVGGIYGAPNFDISDAGTLRITLDKENGESEILSEEHVEPGVGMMLTEGNAAIRDFVIATLDQGLTLNKSVIFAAKNTINPVYDGRFIETFQTVFEQDYAKDYAELGLEVKFDALIDSAVALLPQGKLNNWIVALKNYDGDVASDQLAGESRKLGMMDSTLISLDGTLLADPPHGTADDLETAWLEQGILLANPTAHIFAYAEAIRHKAELENQPHIADMAIALKESVVETIENGHMTGDLAKVLNDDLASELGGTTDLNGQEIIGLSGQDFITEIKETFYRRLNNDPAFNDNPNLSTNTL